MRRPNVRVKFMRSRVISITRALRPQITAFRLRRLSEAHNLMHVKYANAWSMLKHRNDVDAYLNAAYRLRPSYQDSCLVGKTYPETCIIDDKLLRLGYSWQR